MKKIRTAEVYTGDLNPDGWTMETETSRFLSLGAEGVEQCWETSSPGDKYRPSRNTEKDDAIKVSGRTR